MSDYSLLNLGDIGEPAAEVTNNFIDKVFKALGWVVTPKEMKSYVNGANKSLIDEIANRTDINPIERAVIVNNYKKIIKQYKNQVDILQIATEHLMPSAKPDDVKNDWINFFFEKVKDVTEDDMKEIWGRILAGEFNEPNTYTKQLLHTLSIMDSTLAKRFQKIRSSCFFAPPNIYAFIYRINGKEIKNIKKYQEMGIYISDLKELDNLGLIQHRFSDFHTMVVKNKNFYYGDKIITLNTDKRSIALGNVTLTSVGKQLCRISPMIYDEKILEICVDAWKQLGYNPTVEENNNYENKQN